MNAPQSLDWITGADGELIGRFVAALRACAGYDNNWLRTATMGLRLALPLREAMRSAGGLNLEVLTEQLEQLASAGISEEFIVRAARDEVTRETGRLADTAGINAQRQRMVAFLDQMRDDRTLLDRMRRRQEDTAASDDDLRHRLQLVRDRMAPLGPDDAARSWTWSSRWVAARNIYISDAHCDEWFAARRQSGQPPWRE